jgi:hypothetical protein
VDAPATIGSARVSATTIHLSTAHRCQPPATTSDRAGDDPIRLYACGTFRPRGTGGGRSGGTKDPIDRGRLAVPL